MKRLAALALIILLAGCSKQTAKSLRISIAVIPKGTMHEFWKTVHAGAVKASRELDVDVIWKGPIKEDDRDAQIAVVEDFISKGVSGIVLAPLDDAALRAPVANATKTGIPVVIFDSGLQGSDFISFVATDNFKGGQIAGEHLAKLLNGKGSVIMLRYSEGSNSTMLREKGFMDAMSKHSGIKVVSSNQYGGVTPESAYKASENLLSRFKDVDGIFCPNESTTFGMLRALQDGGFAGKIKFVGFDSSQQLIDGLKRGQIQGLVLQNPMKMGYMAVKTLVQSLRGQRVEKRIDTGATLVTPQNMNDPEMKALLKPDLEKWLK
ncbi:MAG TPA: substrate-binding domain-containing protein [Armatimonadota bacterium]|nr:substrate-binding domain-containing protein [Armatimonadota bacterium]